MVDDAPYFVVSRKGGKVECLLGSALLEIGPNFAAVIVADLIRHMQNAFGWNRLDVAGEVVASLAGDDSCRELNTVDLGNPRPGLSVVPDPPGDGAA